MNPTPSQQLDAAASRIAVPKATKSAAREFAALLARFDGADGRETGGEAATAQNPGKTRPSGERAAATAVRNAEETAGRTADAASRTTPDTTRPPRARSPWKRPSATTATTINAGPAVDH